MLGNRCAILISGQLSSKFGNFKINRVYSEHINNSGQQWTLCQPLTQLLKPQSRPLHQVSEPVSQMRKPRSRHSTLVHSCTATGFRENSKTGKSCAYIWTHYYMVTYLYPNIPPNNLICLNIQVILYVLNLGYFPIWNRHPKQGFPWPPQSLWRHRNKIKDVGPFSLASS